jgi:hypothetical protein
MILSDFKFETAPSVIGDIIEQNKNSLFSHFSTMLDGIPQDFAGKMIVFPDFYHYAAVYFHDKDIAVEIADEYIGKRNYKAPGIHDNGNLEIGGIFNRLADSDGPKPHLNADGVRSSHSYPLTSDQVHRASEFIVNNPAYIRGLAALQGCIASYMGDLIRTVSVHAGTDRKSQFIIAKLDHEFTRNADGFGFGDLSVAMAALLAERQEKIYPEAIDKRIIPELFMMHAFKSSAYLDGIPDARLCPFSSNFRKVMSMKLTEESDGTINVSPGEFGQSISSLIRILPPVSGTGISTPDVRP